MKVSEYIPFYGLLFDIEYFTKINGKEITVNQMFEDYPEFELTDVHIEQLYYFDLASLQAALKHEYFTPQTVVPYLRSLFDNYRSSGGNPFVWLQATFESVNMNPQNYKPELRAPIEQSLIEWIEIFNKQPFDCLYLTTNPETVPHQQTGKKIEPKPVLDTKVVQIVFDIIKGYFSNEHQRKLKQILKTGNNTSEKLLFNGNGNMLTDTFKKLIEHRFIKGCTKLDLINWIILNFNFTHRNKMKAFIYTTVEKTISRKNYHCKAPLIEIKDGQIQKAEQPQIKY